jgi:polo-like kinase 1
LQHFKSYLETHEEGNGSGYAEPVIPQTPPTAGQGSSNNNIYVKKWMRTKHAIMFRLSNKIV